MTVGEPVAAAGDHAVERGRLQADAVGGSFWTSVQVFLGLPVATVANVVVAHRLGVGAYGTLAIYTLVFGVAATVLNAGMSDATVQWLATHRARREAAAAAMMIRRCSGFHVLVQAPVFAALAAFLLRGSGWVAMGVGASASALLVVVGTSTVVLSGTAMNALAAKIALVSTVAGQTVVVGVAAASPTAVSILVARLALGLLPALLALALLPPPLRTAVLRPVLPRGLPAGFWPYALRTGASGVVASLVFGRPELLVFDAYGRAEQAGVFALAAGVAALITAPVDALLGPLLPATAGLLAISPERAGAALLRGLRTSAMLAGLVLAVGVPVAAPLLPVVYGRAFSGATAPFVVLAVVSCLGSVNHPVHAFLLAARRTGLLLGVAVASLVVDGVVAAATIPTLGVTGGVIATSVAQLGTLVVIARRVGAALQVPATDQLRAALFLIPSVTAGCLALLAGYVVRDGGWAAQAAVGAVVALACVAVGGRALPGIGLDATDVQVIAGNLPRRCAPVFALAVRSLGLQARRA